MTVNNCFFFMRSVCANESKIWNDTPTKIKCNKCKRIFTVRHVGVRFFMKHVLKCCWKLYGCVWPIVCLFFKCFLSILCAMLRVIDQKPNTLLADISIGRCNVLNATFLHFVLTIFPEFVYESTHYHNVCLIDSFHN